MNLIRNLILLAQPAVVAPLLITGIAPTVASQTPSPDSAQIRAAGDSAIAHKDWARLVAVYEPVTRAQARSGMAWFRLGVGLQETRQLSRAAVALRQSAKLGFQPAQSEYHLAQVFARSGQLDSAELHVTRAAQAGLLVEIITNDPLFTSLHKNAPYVAMIDSLESIRYPCRKLSEAHQFDFWIGDWEVTGWNGPAVTIGPKAVNRITADYQHCVISEHWTSASGNRGESMNFWDPNRRAWRQIWMDENQWSLDYEGEFKDNAMRFHGWTLGPDGARRLEKLTFFRIGSDTVRQLFEQSSDSGRTWQTTFDGRYVRMKKLESHRSNGSRQ